MSTLGEATIITLGLGDWLVGHAVINGAPAIVFTPAKARGVPGDDAGKHEGPLPADAVVLRFLTGDAACRHLDRLKMAVAALAAGE